MKNKTEIESFNPGVEEQERIANAKREASLAPSGCYVADAPDTMLQAVIESISRKSETLRKENRINDSMDCEVWARHLAWVRAAMRHNGSRG